MKENSKLAVELHRQHMLYCLPLFYLGLYLHDEQKRKHNYTRFQNGPDVRHPNLEKRLLHRPESKLCPVSKYTSDSDSLCQLYYCACAEAPLLLLPL